MHFSEYKLIKLYWKGMFYVLNNEFPYVLLL